MRESIPFLPGFFNLFIPIVIPRDSFPKDLLLRQKQIPHRLKPDSE